MKSIEVALFEFQACKISSCLNAHEKHVALLQRLTRVQRSPVKNFLCCFVQHVAFHFTAKYWTKIFRYKGVTISWNSNSKIPRIFWSNPLEKHQFQILIISEIQVGFQKFQLCWAQKPEIFPLIKFREFWWGSDEKSLFCWITWHGMTLVKDETHSALTQRSLTVQALVAVNTIVP